MISINLPTSSTLLTLLLLDMIDLSHMFLYIFPGDILGNILTYDGFLWSVCNYDLYCLLYLYSSFWEHTQSLGLVISLVSHLCTPWDYIIENNTISSMTILKDEYWIRLSLNLQNKFFNPNVDVFIINYHYPRAQWPCAAISLSPRYIQTWVILMWIPWF